MLRSPSRPLRKEHKYSYIPPYVLLSIDYPHYLESVIYSTPQPDLEPGFEKLKQTLDGKASQGSPVLVQARASRRGYSESLFTDLPRGCLLGNSPLVDAETLLTKLVDVRFLRLPWCFHLYAALAT